MKIIILLGFLFTVSCDDPLQKEFANIDVDGNGIITEMEWIVFFLTGDTNGDGMLTFQEYAKLDPPGLSKVSHEESFHYYIKLDKKNDNVLTKSDVGYIFKTLDKNDDEEVTFQEYEEGINHVRFHITKKMMDKWTEQEM